MGRGKNLEDRSGVDAWKDLSYGICLGGEGYQYLSTRGFDGV